MTTFKVGYLIGSLAKGSINRKLATALTLVAPEHLTFTEIPIKDLPLYSYDYDADFPPAGRALKEAIAGVDAVLFVTPEYNRSIPGALKNAIDWASRPWGENAFDHIKRGYYSIKSFNPNGIVPLGPALGFERFLADAERKAA